MKENWEKEFNEKWYLWDYSEKLDTYNTCGEAVKYFIRQLLVKQKEELMGEINKEYKKAEKMEGYDVKKAIVVMNVLNKIKEKL